MAVKNDIFEIIHKIMDAEPPRPLRIHGKGKGLKDLSFREPTEPRSRRARLVDGFYDFLYYAFWVAYFALSVAAIALFVVVFASTFLVGR